MFLLLTIPLSDQIGTCVIIWKLLSLAFKCFSCLLLSNGLICIAKTSNIGIKIYEKGKFWTPHVPLLVQLRVHSPSTLMSKDCQSSPYVLQITLKDIKVTLLNNFDIQLREWGWIELTMYACLEPCELL